MLNSKSQRELCYLVKIDNILPIEGSDNCEAAIIGGWQVMIRKGTFKPNDLAIYFEIDSQLPAIEAFSFLSAKHYKVKAQRYTFGGKGNFISQGLLIAPSELSLDISKCNLEDDTRFLTEKLNITYSTPEDNIRKARPMDKYKRMAQLYPKIFKNKYIQKLYSSTIGKRILYIFFGKKKTNELRFPVKFPYIAPTDQERCENLPWILSDKTPYIRTQKCDGSSATYILERLPFNRYKFYVCSRHVHLLKPSQKCFYEANYYWEMAIKYDIENKLKDYLLKHKNLKYVCWQGEICGPAIQSNPHKLKETHLFLFHFIDSEKGKYDIREAANIWRNYNMEVVPIDNELYIFPDDFEEFKLSADGNYAPFVCGGEVNCPREGYVYYKTTDPNFSFKNVSRNYILSKN